MEFLENRRSWENQKKPENRLKSGLFWASPFTMHLVGTLLTRWVYSRVLWLLMFAWQFWRRTYTSKTEKAIEVLWTPLILTRNHTLEHCNRWGTDRIWKIEWLHDHHKTVCEQSVTAIMFSNQATWGTRQKRESWVLAGNAAHRWPWEPLILASQRQRDILVEMKWGELA